MRDPLPEPAPSAHSETLWLRVRRSLIGSVLGRRMLGQYVGAAMLPIGALAVLDYLHAGNIHFIQVSALAAALVIVLGAWQTRRIVDPLHRLLAGTRGIMEHDFSHQIAASGRDEIAQLSRAFNEMARSLGMNFATLHVLSQIDKTILTKLDIGEVAKSALSCVRYVTSAHVVILGLYESEAAELMRIYALRRNGTPKIRAKFTLTELQRTCEVILVSRIGALGPFRDRRNGASR